MLWLCVICPGVEFPGFCVICDVWVYNRFGYFSGFGLRLVLVRLVGIWNLSALVFGFGFLD